MKKANFLKVCAFAAVALFATSCSEETLDINGGSINVPEFTLPAPTASISVTVVDLEAGKIVGKVTSIDATNEIGGTKLVPCPANEGYTTAAAVEVAVPPLKDGQSINIPVTFYVATLESELRKFMDGVSATITKVEDEEADVKELLLTNAKNENVWKNGNVYENATNNNLVAFEKSPLFFYDYKEGFEFAKEAEEKVDSKAAETTLLDIIKVAKFKTIEGVNSWDIAAWTIFTVKKITQEFYLANIKFENKGLNQSIEFIANVAGEVTFTKEAQNIETGHNNHNGSEDNGHNNSHNGHDNSHGNDNAGGGMSNNEGE